MTHPTPEQARQQLVDADTLQAATQAGAEHDGMVFAVTTAAIGVLVAAVLANSYAFAPHHKLAFGLGFAVYGLALVAVVLWQRHAASVSRRGYGRTYTVSLLATMVLYSAGIIYTSVNRPSWALVGPYCVLVAMPMLVAAVRMQRRPRS